MLTCSPELYAALNRFAAASGLSLSAAVLEFLEPATGVINDLAAAVEDARNKRLSAFGRVAKMAYGSAQRQAEMMGDVSKIFEKLGEAADHASSSEKLKLDQPKDTTKRRRKRSYGG